MKAITTIPATVAISDGPKIVFIVPYRDRANNLNVFRVMMTHVLEDHDPCSFEVFFAHQDDTRPFNRGGIKNAGFMAVRDRYPNTYRDITFVFNDVDTVPSMKGLLPYETVRGVIKHFYGVKFALGGIFSITGHDFELINGFPCYWSWGYEDNVLNTRALKCGLTIDRSVFFNIGDSAILQTVDSYVKAVNRRHKEEMRNDDGSDGVSSITNVQYRFEKASDDAASPMVGSFIHVSEFEPSHRVEHERIMNYDLINKRYVRHSPQLPRHPKNVDQELEQTNGNGDSPLPARRSRGLVMTRR